MANTKISQLPIWTGSAADIRYFVMNNSAENETFKFSGYTSPFRSADGADSIVAGYLPTSRATGPYSLVGGQGTTSSVNNNSIVWGKNNRITQDTQFGNAVFGDSNTVGGGSGANLIGGQNGYNGGAYNCQVGEGSSVYGNNNGVFGRSHQMSGGRGFVAGNQNTITNGDGAICMGDQHSMNNTASDSYDTIVGGRLNKVNNALYCGIFGGYGNGLSGTSSTLSDNIYGSVILGGSANTLSSNYSAIIGGIKNSITTPGSGGAFIGGGSGNTITNSSHKIFGVNNTLTGGEARDGIGHFVAGKNNTSSSPYDDGSGVFGTNHSGLGWLSGVFGYNNNVAYSTKGFIAGENHSVNGEQPNIFGSTNTIDGSYGAFVFGRNNSTKGFATTFEFPVVMGGYQNKSEYGVYTSVVGGTNNRVLSLDSGNRIYNSGIFGGQNNLISSGNSSTIVGGENNTISAGANSGGIFGGDTNTLSGATNFSTIIGGRYNVNGGNYSTIFAGGENTIKNIATEYSTIVGSYSSSTEGDHSHIFGGISNQIVCPQAVIVGGRENSITAGCDNSEMLGSRNSIISGNSVDTTFINTISTNSSGYDRIVMIGTSGRTANADDTTYVENLKLYGKITTEDKVSIGTGTTPTIGGDVAIGFNAVTSGAFGGIAIGKSVSAGGSISKGIAIGENVSATGRGYGFGSTVSSNGDASIGIGRNIMASNDTSIGIGGDVNSTAFLSIGIGRLANATGANSIMLGSYSSASGLGSMILGGGTYSVPNTNAGEFSSIVNGFGNTIDASSKNSSIIGGTGNTISGKSNVVMLGTSGKTATTNAATFVENLVVFNYSNLNFADDTAAAAGGVVLGQVYHTGGVLKIRIV